MLILQPENNAPIPVMCTVKWWRCLHETHRWQTLYWQFTVCIKQFADGHRLWNAEICRSTKHTPGAELGMFTWKKNENEVRDKETDLEETKHQGGDLGKNEKPQQKCCWSKRELFPQWLMTPVKLRLFEGKKNKYIYIWWLQTYARLSLIPPSSLGRLGYYFTPVHALKFKMAFSPLSTKSLPYCK